MQLDCLTLTHWVAIYPADSAIQRLNNRSPGEVAGNSKVSIGMQGPPILTECINSGILIQTFEFPVILLCLPMMQLRA